MRHSKFFLYTASALLCAAGILMAIVSEVWAGNAPMGPGASATQGADASPAPAQQAIWQQGGKTGAAPQGTITAGMTIYWVSKYTLCGHEIVRSQTADAAMAGKTFAQFAALHPDYAPELAGSSLRMVRTYNQYCPDHYIIKSDDGGFIYVYRNMEGKDRLTVVMKMNFTADAVPQDYKPLLKEGMAFGSVEEIEGLIEDAET